MIGCDLRHLEPDTQQSATQPGLLALDQDELGQPGFPRRAHGLDGGLRKRNLAGGALAVALLNRGEAAAQITTDWQALGLQDGMPLELRDVLSGVNLGTFCGRFQAEVGPHATVLLRAVEALERLKCEMGET